MREFILIFVSSMAFMVLSAILNLPMYVNQPFAHVLIVIHLSAFGTYILLRGNWTSKVLLFLGSCLLVLAGYVFFWDREDGIFLYLYSVLILITSFLIAIEHSAQSAP